MSALQEAAPELITRPMVNGNFAAKNLLSIDQFTREDVADFLVVATEMEAARKAGNIPRLLDGKLVQAVFFEDSSRTANGYLAAAAYLGAAQLQPNIATSSKQKGETDIETVECFAANSDGLLVRHGEAGFMDTIARRISTPFISAGNPHDHVTQSLKDAFTWEKEYGGIDGSRVVIAGHLSEYRAAISLVKLLGLYDDVDLTLATPDFGKMPADIVQRARQQGVTVTETDNLRPLLKEPGRFYFARPVYSSEEEKIKILEAYDKNGYEASHETMRDAHSAADVFHALPHNGEIANDFYTDGRAKYKPQEAKGIYIHMAGLALQLAPEALAKYRDSSKDLPQLTVVRSE